MINTNPKLYKIAKKQLEKLRKLALMSANIDDREGAEIIHAAETAIERRIQDTSMNLSALEYFQRLINKGHHYDDAEWRTIGRYDISRKALKAQVVEMNQNRIT
jgi:hypothetical protein